MFMSAFEGFMFSFESSHITNLLLELSLSMSAFEGFLF